MKRITLMVLAAAALLAQRAVHAADGLEAGRKKAEEACAACHGKAGGKPVLPNAPVLAGQQPEYLVHALKAFRSGAREDPLMGPLAKSLSDAEIRDISVYYSTLPGLHTKY